MMHSMYDNEVVIFTFLKCPPISLSLSLYIYIYIYLLLSGHYTYCQFNIQQFYFLSTQCIYVFCVDLRTNSDYFPIQH